MVRPCQVTIKTNINCKTTTDVIRGTNVHPAKSQISRLGFANKCIKSILSLPRVLTLNAGDNGQHALPSDAVYCLINSIKRYVSRMRLVLLRLQRPGPTGGWPLRGPAPLVIGRKKIEVRRRASHRAWGKVDTVDTHGRVDEFGVRIQHLKDRMHRRWASFKYLSKWRFDGCRLSVRWLSRSNPTYFPSITHLPQTCLMFAGFNPPEQNLCTQLRLPDLTFRGIFHDVLKPNSRHSAFYTTGMQFTESIINPTQCENTCLYFPPPCGLQTYKEKRKAN